MTSQEQQLAARQFAADWKDKGYEKGESQKFWLDTRNFRRALIDLFKIFDTKPDERDPYIDKELAAFPYVNEGLFSDENIEIPQFTDELRNLILVKASDEFDWNEISPTILGAIFESTLTPETRRSGGMHYTSIENILFFIARLHIIYVSEREKINTQTFQNENKVYC